MQHLTFRPYPFPNFTCNFTYEILFSYVNCLNSICEIKISCVKLIFICWFTIWYVKYTFRTPAFHMWNFKLIHFTYELSISYVETFPFHTWNESFLVCENVPIPYVFHMWNAMWNFRQGTLATSSENYISYLHQLKERSTKYKSYRQQKQ